MKTPRTRIASTVADRTLNGTDQKQLSRELAAYLISEGRVDELDSLLRDVQADWADAGYVEVLAHSAHTLEADVKAEIEQQMRRVYPNANRIVVTEVHDPSVIGGVQLQLADKQLDLSVEGKLNKFKQLTEAKS